MDEFNYHRPYCVSCNSIYSIYTVGVLSNCPKCGRPLILKSFNPWIETVKGLVIILGFGVTLLFLPIIWIGGLIWGAHIIYQGHKQWLEIRKLDKKIEQKIKNVKSVEEEKKKSEISITSYCPNCGVGIKKGASFCSQCGEKIR